MYIKVYERVQTYTSVSTYLFQKKMLSEFTSKWKQISYEKNGLMQCISKEEGRDFLTYTFV